MRNIKYIVIHCTATPTSTTIESIKRFWKEERGWGDTPGYHYIIKRNGAIIQLLDETKNSNGVYAHNSECINIAYMGGIDKEGKSIDNRTHEQKQALFDKLVALTEKHKGAEPIGHRDIPNVHKDCPCFDVKEWLKNHVPDVLTQIDSEDDNDEHNFNESDFV
jgi:N-acetylmuramoyl-L-alanine amidase